MDCGPTCLRMIAKHYGRSLSLQKLRALSETTRQGSTLSYLSEAAEAIGFRSLGVKVDFDKLEADAPLPCIVFWDQNHFVVVYKIRKDKVWVADPACGLIKYAKQDFLRHWVGPNADAASAQGIALLLEPTPGLTRSEDDDVAAPRNLWFLSDYLLRYKGLLVQLFVGLLASNALQLLFPFLTQSVVDIGIPNQDIHFIYLILAAQVFLSLGSMSLSFLQSWLFLHISGRVHIALVSDFLIKLMKLPMAFFDVKMTGDLMRRLDDHDRVQSLLTSAPLNVLFSLFNLVTFGGALWWYSPKLLLVFGLGSFFYVLWILGFLKKRRQMDHKQFAQSSAEQSKLIELIEGMQDIKLHNAERRKRWGWEYLQARAFRLRARRLRLEQIQSVGASLINQIKNVLLTTIAAHMVIQGQLTLGMLMAVSYITGQLNGPIEQFIGLIYTLQDADVALERLSEIHQKAEESVSSSWIASTSTAQTLQLKQVGFRYTGSHKTTLENVSFEIPLGRVTAIVGASGSGKTTLMKLLLKFYEPTQGKIEWGQSNLSGVPHAWWRDRCGVVMQEGHIFNDTIAYNIALGAEEVDMNQLLRVASMAHVQEFVESLPLGYNTKIGPEGMGLSTGQKQRLLIARALYKNPDYLFFDEATSALDTESEAVVTQNLAQFFEGRTAVVIAHRLSTVQSADQIVVLGAGKVVEIGTHQQLIAQQGSYFSLVKNQLDLS